MTPADLSPRAERLAELLRAWPRKRVSRGELWSLLEQADPSIGMSLRRRRILAGLLDELAAEAVLRLPSKRSYDYSEQPPLPNFVTVPKDTSSARRGREPVWHPELRWVPDASLNQSQVDKLAAINSWLHQNRGDLVVPVRERSLEIFGDEKVLDDLVRGSLFAEGRLRPELLRVRRAVPRMYTESVGDGDVLLVVENSDTFDSLTRVLAAEPGRIGLVGWGAGTGFEASILSVGQLDRRITEIRYFGDLDGAGLRTPASASELGQASGFSPVRPAVPLYDALLRLGRPQSGQKRLSPNAARALAGWLDPAQQEAVTSLLSSGERLAQEAVGLAYLLSDNGWRDL
ncbi:MAG: hypothetical protein GEU98_04025 [Pseudonocardiaceae bacterium]|nr:hypothetical protein [Pseudonocardiaceae bacterium]